MEGPEWDVQAHGTVHSRSVAEETAISVGGVEGGRRQRFQSLWAPPGDGDLLQIHEAVNIGNGQRLAGGGEELGPGEEGL